MKFPRNARVTKGSLEAAPWAAVMFLLVIFIMLGGLLYTPGVHVQLPATDELPGLDKPTVTVAMDATGRIFFENQLVTAESLLTNRWHELIRAAPEKPALVVQADKGVSYESLVRLLQLGRAAGFETTVLATLPRPAGKTISPRP
jgi:biopolymer transport protein ExbD